VTDAAGISAFIQARMSSERFPGKVLAPFEGRAMIAVVIDRLRPAVAVERIVLATSDDATDDPLAHYVETLGIQVFRGPLDDVFARFQGCLAAHPCEWFYRVCADSPLLSPALLDRAARLRSADLDLVTNVFPRTFPKGQSVELVRAETFAGIDARGLTGELREHLTGVYYAQPHRFRIKNFAAEGGAAGPDLAVDTVDDLRRLARRTAASV
jgi:spore coat polysaccharide biosynthesis protein SpsF